MEACGSPRISSSTRDRPFELSPIRPRRHVGFARFPVSGNAVSHDLASSPLILPEYGLAAVYSRHSRLREPYAGAK
jgi:hypothetical protein